MRIGTETRVPNPQEVFASQGRRNPIASVHMILFETSRRTLALPRSMSSRLATCRSRLPGGTGGWHRDREEPVPPGRRDLQKPDGLVWKRRFTWTFQLQVRSQ